MIKHILALITYDQNPEMIYFDMVHHLQVITDITALCDTLLGSFFFLVSHLQHVVTNDDPDVGSI